MPDSPDWKPLLEHRRRMLDQPDDSTIQLHIDRWRNLLAEGGLPEDELDQQLVKLLEKIHHDF